MNTRNGNHVRKTAKLPGKNWDGGVSKCGNHYLSDDKLYRRLARQRIQEARDKQS